MIQKDNLVGEECCVKCKCGSKRVVKFGKIPTVQNGKKQRYRCQECGRTFYEKIR